MTGLGSRGQLAGAAAAFAALSALWTWVSWGQGAAHLSGDTQNILLMVLKQVHPELFTRDGIFSDPATFAFYTPAARHYLAWTYRLSGDLLWGLRLLIFPLNFLFLWGAYYLFRYLFHRHWLSVSLALLASLPVFLKLAEETYGIGPWRYLYPRTAFTAFLPWLILGFLAWRDRLWPLLALFALTGVLANLHPPSGFLLVQVMALTLLFLQRFAWRSFLTAGILGLAALPGALPSVLAYLGQGRYIDVTPWGYDQFYTLARDSFRQFFYPPQNLALILPEGLIHLATAALAGLSLACLWRPQAWSGRLLRLTAVLSLAYMLYFDREITFWLTFLAFYALFLAAPPDRTRELLPIFLLIFSVYWVAVIGMFLLTVAAQLFKIQPDLNQSRAVRFAPLLLFALVGEAWLALRNLTPAWRPRQVAGVVLLMLALFMTVRWNYRTLIVPRPDPALSALEEVAAWARTHTSVDALFLFDSLTFRLLAQRAVTGCYKDRGITFASGRNFEQWRAHDRELRAAAGRPDELHRLAVLRGADYVILGPEARHAPLPSPPVFSNGHYYVFQISPSPRPLTPSPGIPPR